MGRLDDAERVFADSPAEWADWLTRHHERDDGVWLVRWKVSSGRDPAPMADYTKESLRFGWIDSVPRRADDPDRTMLWCAPRRPGSGWSGVNKRLIDELRTEGRLEASGQAAVDRARRDGTWSLLDEVEAGVIPADLAAAFAAHPTSREAWETFPRSARRGMLEWVVTAKSPATRARRIDKIASHAARGERALG